jgi:hypothetical protein
MVRFFTRRLYTRHSTSSATKPPPGSNRARVSHIDCMTVRSFGDCRADQSQKTSGKLTFSESRSDKVRIHPWFVPCWKNKRKSGPANHESKVPTVDESGGSYKNSPLCDFCVPLRQTNIFPIPLRNRGLLEVEGTHEKMLAGCLEGFSGGNIEDSEYPAYWLSRHTIKNHRLQSVRVVPSPPQYG